MNKEPSNNALLEAIIDLRNGMGERFDAVDAKLAEHDRRFDEHDRRFDEHDRRFDTIDRCLDRLAHPSGAA